MITKYIHYDNYGKNNKNYTIIIIIIIIIIAGQRSHDGYVTKADGTLVADQNSRYASQMTVFDDLGKGVLNNAFQGHR